MERPPSQATETQLRQVAHTNALALLASTRGNKDHPLLVAVMARYPTVGKPTHVPPDGTREQ